jgi:hypothetical protein
MEAERFGFIIAMEMAATRNWLNVWLESDFKSALLALKNPSI